ncbi:hypothetical protein POX_d05523 [Penicillium oxalicum]|uniref:Uncharacterized protein n=1 Tax=Penicillium oxalicum (strain 114-2 / CGMCC 5302) TaxID=933388 RepID=S7ZNS6_PENO1|nr:hypothetical protein POX_d05523 [Penicillium oxalicum]EPS32315.1 hypothetical protein PDE_07275 [Penicillium oxalicum 114-2]KAI2790020.1 hypothetical protein POX_d05523 [Penicillium oxalicum]
MNGDREWLGMIRLLQSRADRHVQLSTLALPIANRVRILNPPKKFIVQSRYLYEFRDIQTSRTTGKEQHHTPISQSERFHHAIIQKVVIFT